MLKSSGQVMVFVTMLIPRGKLLRELQKSFERADVPNEKFVCKLKP